MKLKKILGATALSTALVAGVVSPAGAAEAPKISAPDVRVSTIYGAFSSDDMSAVDRATTLATAGVMGTVWMAATTILLTNGYNTLVDMGYLPRMVMPPFLR
ncbi:MAG: hypothetical protein Q3962_03040 [Corynebacterium sp.]|nr:hypothetical protein [Corynebacterium sp.]